MPADNDHRREQVQLVLGAVRDKRSSWTSLSDPDLNLIHVLP